MVFNLKLQSKEMQRQAAKAEKEQKKEKLKVKKVRQLILSLSSEMVLPFFLALTLRVPTSPRPWSKVFLSQCITHF